MPLAFVQGNLLPPFFQNQLIHGPLWKSLTSSYRPTECHVTNSATILQCTAPHIGTWCVHVCACCHVFLHTYVIHSCGVLKVTSGLWLVYSDRVSHWIWNSPVLVISQPACSRASLCCLRSAKISGHYHTCTAFLHVCWESRLRSSSFLSKHFIHRAISSDLYNLISMFGFQFYSFIFF